MKYTLVLITALCLILEGCSLQETTTTSKEVYFKFTEKDKLKLVKPEIVGTVLKYKNQLGVVREFNIDKCELHKDADVQGGGMGFFSSHATINYYFDTQDTEATYVDENGSINLRVYFQNRPQTTDITTYPNKYSNPKFSGFLTFSIYNKNCKVTYNSSCGYTPFESGTMIPTFNIEGKEYKNVIVFDSYSTKVFPSENTNNVYGKTVKKIYYSYDNFMIGYDEVDGTTWRIEN